VKVGLHLQVGNAFGCLLLAARERGRGNARSAKTTTKLKLKRTSIYHPGVGEFFSTTQRIYHAGANNQE
jgi:hypothetical protein